MGTYTLEGLADFIFKLFDEVNEEDIYQTWLHKESNLGFAEFKKKYLKKPSNAKHKTLNKEEEERNIKEAARFIKPRNEGGETINDG